MVTSSVITGSVLDNITHERGGASSNTSLTQSIYTVPADRFAYIQFHTISASAVASGSANIGIYNAADENMVDILSASASTSAAGSNMFWSQIDDAQTGPTHPNGLIMDEDWELRTILTGAGGPASSSSWRFLVMEYIK